MLCIKIWNATLSNALHAFKGKMERMGKEQNQNQHFKLIPARNSSSRISNITCTPTNSAEQANTRYNRPE